ncbi:MAG: NHLP family bacteriocin export ABC transporter peptidase/permease/ATPase subunit [Lachnospiraceae bacterium]|nr:NHLP family bacteriocin export ABC transporter peptidase/permease/ATPase subunit [Lachnospiraceae bacterium]MBR4808641.1 NHLP family bacteriocin export ABC transporter peptidase/permease/ATPase subunit [Lachnospiraceae bacterium]
MAKQGIKQPIEHGVAKVPVVMQMEALECGAASLCMVLAYYNKWIPLEQARLDCGVSRDGSNAFNVLKAAENYGMEAAGYKLEPEELFEDGMFPCIVHWEFNHFVVCDGIKGDRVYLNDPAKGSYSVTREVFDDAFTGIVLMMEPGEDFQPGGKPKSVKDFVIKRLAGTGVAFAFVVITTVISSLMGILNAGFTRVFYDQLLQGRNMDWVFPFFIGLGIITLVEIVTAWVQAIYSLRINGKMDAVGNSTFMWKILHLPMEFFTQRLAGDIQGRQASNASIASTVVNTVAPLFLNTAMMFFYLIVMIRHSIVLTCIGLLSVAVNAAVSKFISNKRINITRVMMRDQGKLSAATVGAVDMIETIKASGAENGYFEKWSGYQASVNTQTVRFQKQDTVLGFIPGMVSGILDTLVLCLGILYTLQGNFTVGMITAFQGFMNSFTAPASMLISAGQVIQEMKTSMERIEDVMEYPDDPAFNREEATEYSKLSGTLSMKNVTFGYSRLADPLITDFNLEIKTGQRVAFVGPSGCGKSTLSKLISGLYAPWSGEILFDGKPIDTIDRNIFTGSVAVVDQDIILFEDSISGNIKMWDSSIEDFEMIMAARDAKIHDDIMERQGGYQYKITEGGKDFSGGQRQRLEIARVLAQDPTMIIMDEATSALDARTEYEVVKSIKDRGITCIVIAHRLSTIRDCDEIIVLDHGKVVERGTHEELMKLDGTYKTLVTSE